jgi:hypothetical protein
MFLFHIFGIHLHISNTHNSNANQVSDNNIAMYDLPFPAWRDSNPRPSVLEVETLTPTPRRQLSHLELCRDIFKPHLHCSDFNLRIFLHLQF